MSKIADVVNPAVEACLRLIDEAAARAEAPLSLRMTVLDFLVAQIISDMVAAGLDRGRVFRLHEKHTRDIFEHLQHEASDPRFGDHVTGGGPEAMP